MKFTCPQCGEKAVRGFSKFMSQETSPAVRSSCGKYSTEPLWHSKIDALTRQQVVFQARQLIVDDDDKAGLFDFVNNAQRFTPPATS